MWFILASISGQIQSQNSKALPRFARPCGIVYCRFNLRANSRALASFARRRGFSSLKSPVKFRAKIQELCFASLGHVVFLGSNRRANLERKFESSAMFVVYFVGCQANREFENAPGKTGNFL